MSLATVRASAATALKTITFDDGKKLRADTYLTDQVNTPNAFFDFEIGEQLTFSNASPNAFTMHIQVVDARDSERASQIRLDELRDPTNTHGLRAVLELGSNWDISIDYCRFRSASRLQVVSIANVEYLAIDFEFEVCI